MYQELQEIQPDVAFLKYVQKVPFEIPKYLILNPFYSNRVRVENIIKFVCTLACRRKAPSPKLVQYCVFYSIPNLIKYSL